MQYCVQYSLALVKLCMRILCHVDSCIHQLKYTKSVPNSMSYYYYRAQGREGIEFVAQKIMEEQKSV